MCRTKNLTGFIVSFIFIITTFAGCAANMGAVNTPETAYHPKLPAGINSFDAAVKDLAGLLENRKDGLEIIFGGGYCRLYSIQDLTLTEEGRQEIEKGFSDFSGAVKLTFWPPPSGDIWIQNLKNIDVRQDMLKVSSRLFVLYTDLPNLPIEVTNASIPLPGWIEVRMGDQIFLNLNSEENARRAADDLYFIQQNYRRHYQKQLALFEASAAQYRELAIKPQVSEEQRKYIVQAEALAQQKEYDKAIDLNLKAIALDPVSYPGGYSNLALLCAQLHRFNPAIDYMKQYLMLVPDARDARDARDKIYVWEGMIGE
jgi:tetratricopeptide (TPR) repeat protein